MISALKVSALAASCFFALQNTTSDQHAFSFFGLFNKKKKNHLTKTYIWGNGYYQPRPEITHELYKNLEPKLIKSFLGEKSINFTKLSFGEYHEGGIDTKGNLYIWRKHKIDASLPNQEKDEFRTDLIQLDNSGKIKQLSFSKGSIWALHANGDVFQWQIKIVDFEDQDDIKFQINKKGKKIDALKDIVQLQTGDDHFVALDKHGSVWTMGDDTYGQCGLGANNRSTVPPYFQTRIQEPTKIQEVSNIAKIVCGESHTLALTAEGLVYGWGRNSYMQLSQEKEFLSKEKPLLAIYTPIRIEKNLELALATDIAAGKDHSIIVTKNKESGEIEVFGFGRNNAGQLGVRAQGLPSDVIKIPSLSNFKLTTAEGESDIRVNQIQCGSNHCIALLSAGAVLHWGENQFGQLGNRKRVYSDSPSIIADFTEEKVVTVGARLLNSFVVTEYDEELEKIRAAQPKKKKVEESDDDD